MNIDLTEEQQMLKNMVREFARNEIEPKAKELEEKHEFPHVFLKKLAELGILGMGVSPDFEGTKTDHLSIYLVIEELSRVMPSLAIIISVHCSLFCHLIGRFGSQEQKGKYLPRAARGEILGAFSLTEPGAGSDISNLLTSAVRESDYYILNGTKAWVTCGSEAESLIIFAQTEIEQGRKKLSAFIVDKDSPGFRVSKIENKMGLNSSLTAEIMLENCRIPASSLLGEEGQGLKIALQGLDGSRIGIAAQALGIAQRALDEALKYSKERGAFGKPLSKIQAIQFKLADIATQLDAARLLTYRAADLFDNKKPFTKEAAMAKLFASEATNKIVYEALQIHGGYGYSKEFIIEQLYRDARVLPIYEGTSEIQRMIIAREIIKGN
jgi:alkylation response protein AidB-like acyl-CoA dehydrogenase